MNGQNNEAAWRRDLQTVEDRLQQRVQILDERINERVQIHESHGTQAIAAVFARSATQVNFMLGLLVTVLGGGLLAIYVGSQAYVDQSLGRAKTELSNAAKTNETELTSSVTRQLEDFKRNLRNDLSNCTGDKPNDTDLRRCLDKALTGLTK